MDLKIFPYTKRDGIRTRTDSDIMALYDRMVEDGTADTVFYSGHVNSREDFLKHMKDPGTHLYVLGIDDEIVGITWLDNLFGKSAFNHFCGFSNCWGENTVAIGRTSLQKLINMKDANGYVFEVFTGLIPAWNKLAIEYAQACGGVNLGVIPGGIWEPAKMQSVDAVVIYYTRETSDG